LLGSGEGDEASVEMWVGALDVFFVSFIKVSFLSVQIATIAA
jgi:hypothetical protein